MLRRILESRLRLVVMMIVAVVAIIAAACGAAEEEAKPTIRFGDNTYESLWINNATAQFIIENGYGYPTETVELTTQLVQVALAEGDVDVWIELWYEYYPIWTDENIASGNLIELEKVMFEGPGFWIVPTYFAEEYNLKTVEDMKRPEVIAALADPEDSSMGLFTNCWIGTQCSKINPAKMRAYGLDKLYNTIEPGTGGAMLAAMAGAHTKEDPIFTYYWSPTSIMGAYDWTVLEESPYTDACWDEVVKGKEDETYTPKEACAYRTSLVTKIIHHGLVDKAPDVVEFLEKFATEGAPLSRTAAWANENDITDWDKSGVYYLKNNEDLWKTWVPQDVYEKVKTALDKVSV